MSLKNQLAEKANGNVATRKQPESIKDWIKVMEPEIKKALPSVITPERFTRMALTAISTNPKLAECTPQSFMGALMNAAQLGLEPNTPLGQAYLIPYRNKGKMEVQFQIGYKGMIDLAHRSGEFANIYAQTVYENDTFDYELGLEPKLVHKPATSNRGEVIMYYAVFKLVNGGFGFEVMSKEDIQEHAKTYSQAYGSGYSPWTKNFDEMAKKGLALDTPIPTPIGWSNMGDMQVGDLVFDMYGEITKVIAVSDIKEIDCFEIEFSNGEKITCDDEHRWVAATGSNAARDVKKKGWETLTINELFEAKKQGKSVIVPIAKPLNLEKKELLIEPWLLGYWLGNGSSRHGNVCCDISVQNEIINKIHSCGYEVGTVRRDERSKAVTIGIIDNFITRLKELNVYRNKHVPEIYFRGSIEQRLSLLRGLMDSDGTIEKDRGRAIFTSTSSKLAYSVYELVHSLGENAHIISKKQTGFGKTVLCYYVEWFPSLSPVTLKYKKQNLKKKKLIQNRVVKSIKKVKSVPTKCIAVEAESKTYLVGKTMVPTHNTVLKKVLKYAPIKVEFVKGIAQDATIKTELNEDMAEVQSENIFDAEYVDEETGEVVEITQGTSGQSEIKG